MADLAVVAGAGGVSEQARGGKKLVELSKSHLRSGGCMKTGAVGIAVRSGRGLLFGHLIRKR